MSDLTRLAVIAQTIQPLAVRNRTFTRGAARVFLFVPKNAVLQSVGWSLARKESKRTVTRIRFISRDNSRTRRIACAVISSEIERHNVGATEEKAQASKTVVAITHASAVREANCSLTLFMNDIVVAAYSILSSNFLSRSV